MTGILILIDGTVQVIGDPDPAALAPLLQQAAAQVVEVARQREAERLRQAWHAMTPVEQAAFMSEE